MTSVPTHILVLFTGVLLGPGLAGGANNLRYRLPDDHVPSEYTLRLTVDPDKDTFNGQTTIIFSTKNVTSSILLHASPSHITNMSNILYNYLHNCAVSNVDNKTEIVNITCGAPIAVSDKNVISITYKGVYGKSGTKDAYLGFYKSGYDTDDGRDNYAVTQFEATFARTAFPCFDEPQFKAKFNVTIIHPTGTSALANTDIETQSKASGKYVIRPSGFLEFVSI